MAGGKKSEVSGFALNRTLPASPRRESAEPTTASPSVEISNVPHEGGDSDSKVDKVMRVHVGSPNDSKG